MTDVTAWRQGSRRHGVAVPTLDRDATMTTPW